MSISITISELRDFMVSQARYRNFYPSFICYAAESYVIDRFNVILGADDESVMNALSKWFGFTLESGNTGTDPNFTNDQLFEWMNLGWRVVCDSDLRLPDTYDVFAPAARMLCRIGMLTWLMDANGIPGDAEIVIETCTEE